MRWLAAAGLAALEGLIALAYDDRGTWWHWMLHQYVGWGLGLSGAGLLAVALHRSAPKRGVPERGVPERGVPERGVPGRRVPGRRAPERRAPGRRVPAVGAMVLGQLVSIFPDLMFRFMRMPHEPWMDWWVGHISMHTGPSPLLVALLVLLFGGWGWLLATSRPRVAVLACLAGPLLLLVACLLARPIPTSLSGYPASVAGPVSR
ncbi:MAG: hypothetical protein NVSMB13_14610 [Mycobacteriales bacterium]